MARLQHTRARASGAGSWALRHEFVRPTGIVQIGDDAARLADLVGGQAHGLIAGEQRLHQIVGDGGVLGRG